MTTFKFTRFARMLNRAGHPSINDSEALVAVRMAAAHCEQFDLGLLGDALLDLVNEANSAPNPYAACNVDLVREATKLETRVRQLTRNRDKWRADSEWLRREHEAEIAARDARIEAEEAAAAETASRNEKQVVEAMERLADLYAEIGAMQVELAKAQ